MKEMCWTAFPLKMGPICCPETSAAIIRRCVTSQKIEDLNYFKVNNSNIILLFTLTRGNYLLVIKGRCMLHCLVLATLRTRYVVSIANDMW
jgi:hypothetical protein